MVTRLVFKKPAFARESLEIGSHKSGSINRASFLQRIPHSIALATVLAPLPFQDE